MPGMDYMVEYITLDHRNDRHTYRNPRYGFCDLWF